jgi:lysophospholipase L1-like esterase
MNVKPLLPLVTALSLLFAAACNSSAETPSLTGVYLALGDSLSEGIGASDRDETSFVALVHDELGPDVELMNLGVAGDTTQELIDTQLDRATQEIDARNNDADPDNDVAVVTLELGGNDLLDIFFELVLPGKCPNLDAGLQTPECVEELRAILDTYRPNLNLILQRLREVDPDLQVFLLTLYNPFSGGSPIIDPLVELALEGRPDTPFPEGLNDIIRAEADASDAHLVDVYPVFEGKAREYISPDAVHPNDTGYEAMATAVLTHMRSAGLIE